MVAVLPERSCCASFHSSRTICAAWEGLGERCGLACPALDPVDVVVADTQLAHGLCQAALHWIRRRRWTVGVGSGERVRGRDAAASSTRERPCQGCVFGTGTADGVGPRRRDVGFWCAEKRRADLYSGRAELDRCGNAAAVADSAAGNDRHTNRIDDRRYAVRTARRVFLSRGVAKAPRCPPASIPCATTTSAPASSAATASATLVAVANQ